MLNFIKRLNFKLSAKKLIFGNECNRIIAQTAYQISKVVSITLGPYSRNIMIEDHKKQPRITKDGITVVKHIQYEDRLKDAICTLIKKSVNATNRFAGDGTTTSTILIGQIVKYGRVALQIGQHHRDIKLGLSIGRDIGIDFLRMSSKKIDKEEDYYKVAMIATKNDQKLSKIISQAVVKSQIIKVEKGHSVQSYVEYFNGVKMVLSIPHPEFKNVGDKVQLDYPLVLIDKRGINSIQQILKPLQLAKKARKQLFLVTTQISDSVLSTLIYNRRKNIVQVFPVIITQYGSISQEYFKQLQKTTEATVFDQYGPCFLKDMEFKHFGKAVRVQMDDIETVVLGKSTQKVSNAIIYAGGQTEAVRLEIFDKIVDALNSVKTAKKHGVVAGGGITYWRLAQLLEKYEGQHEIGVKILAKALKAPRKLLISALDQKYKALGGTGWQAYNFKTQKLQDMFEAGIYDSAIVGETVLVDSISLSQLLLQTNSCVMRISLNNQSNDQIDKIQSSIRL